MASTEPNINQNVSHAYTWKLDTCASAHMTSDIGLFEHPKPVTAGGGANLLAEGIGAALMS